MRRILPAIALAMWGCVPDGTVAPGAPDAATIGDAAAGADAVTLDDAETSSPDASPGLDVLFASDVEPDDDAQAVEDAAATDAAAPDAAAADASPRDAAAPDATPNDGGCDPMAHLAPHVGATEAPGADGCPAGMLRAGSACVDRYEAVLFEVAADGSLTPWSPYHNPGARRVRAASIAGVVPQAYVNGRQAAAACADAGKRLCTDAEWIRACKGARNATYPYGATRQPGVCNDARARHPAIEYFGTSDSWIWSELGNACINQLAMGLARTGAYAGCVTEEGLFDMMGNLHEWTAYPNGTFRGGFYVDTMINGNGCNYATVAHDTGHWDYSTGFRCCADAP